MAICGPCCSLTWTILGVWGAIQMACMGLALVLKSATFAEDLGLPEEPEDLVEFYKQMNSRYGESANNCFMAAGMFVLTLLIAGQQLYSNSKNK